MLDEQDEITGADSAQNLTGADGETGTEPAAAAAPDGPVGPAADPVAQTSGGTASARTPDAGGDVGGDGPGGAPEPQPARKTARKTAKRSTRARKTAASADPAAATATGAGAEDAAGAHPGPAAGSDAGSDAGSTAGPDAGSDVGPDAAAGTEQPAAVRGPAAKKAAKRASKKSAAGGSRKAGAQPLATPEPTPEPTSEDSPSGAQSLVPSPEPSSEPSPGTTATEPAPETLLDAGPAPVAAPALPGADDASGQQGGEEPAEEPAEEPGEEAGEAAGHEPQDEGGERAGAVPAAAVTPLFRAPEPVPASPDHPDDGSEPATDTEPAGGEQDADADQAATTPAQGASEEDEQEPEQESDDEGGGGRRRRRRGGRRRRRGGSEDSQGQADESGVAAPASAGDEPAQSETGGGRGDKQESGRASGADAAAAADEDSQSEAAGSRRRRRRRRGNGDDADGGSEQPATRPARARNAEDEITSLSGSTRLEAKKQRRREGREAGRRRAPIVSEAEFLARREAVDRVMVIRQREDLTQIAVLEDKVLVEHYVARESQTSLIGNVYLGRVQNVLPSMEAAFVDIGKGRNAVLYAGEVNWDALGAGNGPRKIEQVLKSGQPILVQVTKDPVGHKGARLTSQISLPGRFLVYVPDGTTSGISRKLPDTERNRLKTLLKEIVPDTAGVIVRTAAEGATEEELTKDVERLTARWADIEKKVAKGNAPQLLYGEPDLTLKVVRDLFTEDFGKLVVSGDDAWDMVESYVRHVAPDLEERLERYPADRADAADGEASHDGSSDGGSSRGAVQHPDVFAAYRIDEQIAKGLDRKVWLPSGGSLIIDRTEAMTVVDVNTGKFTGSGGNLEETVTRNNLEAAEEIVRQLRLRDIGGIIVIDFIDMVLESNRDLVLRRLVECLGRDRTRHQVAEVTSLGLVQMTRKRIGTGLLEAFSETCEHCQGRGLLLHHEPVELRRRPDEEPRRSRRGRGRGGDNGGGDAGAGNGVPPVRHTPTPADLAAMAKHEHPPVEQEAAAGGDVETARSVSAPQPPPSDAGVAADAAPSPQHSEPEDEDVAAVPDEVAQDARTADAANGHGAAQEVAAPEPAEQQPEVPAAPRLVTTSRRRVARRPAGPPSGEQAPAAETAGQTAGVVVADAAPEPGVTGPDDGVVAEAADRDSAEAESPHVPVKKRGRKR